VKRSQCKVHTSKKKCGAYNNEDWIFLFFLVKSNIELDNVNIFFLKNSLPELVKAYSSVADPDPGSGIRMFFFTPRIRDPRSGIRDEFFPDPGSQT
jgi:hypothetical protein